MEPLKKALFCAEWEMRKGEPHPPLHPGYTDGTYWNGWSKPYFTREEGHKVIQGIIGADTYVKQLCGVTVFPPADTIARYDEEIDAFLIYDSSLEEEEGANPWVPYLGADYQTEDGVLRLYDIGNGDMTWVSHEEGEGNDETD